MTQPNFETGFDELAASSGLPYFDDPLLIEQIRLDIAEADDNVQKLIARGYSGKEAAEAMKPFGLHPWDIAKLATHRVTPEGYEK